MDLVHRPFSGLQHRDAVLRVADSLLVPPNLGTHLLADAQAGGVVGSAVDAEAAGELLQHLAHLQPGDGQVALRIDRSNVGCDLHSHWCCPPNVAPP